MYNLTFEIKEGYVDKRTRAGSWEVWSFGKKLGHIWLLPGRPSAKKYEARVFGIYERTVPQASFRKAVEYLFRRTFADKLEQVHGEA